MASLSSGRVLIGSVGVTNVLFTLSIALWHGLMRRQFNDGPNQQESLLMDYPLHQHWLFTWLAETLHQFIGGWRM